MFWFVFSILLVAIFVAATRFKGNKETIDVKGKAIFITGCDTGFGHGLALRLDRLGMRVYAGCLTEKGIAELRAKCSPAIQPLVCDITNPDDIANAVRIISSGCPDGLYALVNNAGIAGAGEWDWSPEKHLRKVMEVNFFGHVAVTKAFLPFLKKTKGRIINLTSVAGVVALPKLGSYSCSKFAMEAFNDSLRREMRKWGITVYVIEPGFTATPMVAGFGDILQKAWDETSDETKREYGEEYATSVKTLKSRSMDHPDLVINELVSAVTLKHPAPRTRVGKLAKFGYIFHTFLPTSWADKIIEMNNKPPIPAAMNKKAQ